MRNRLLGRIAPFALVAGVVLAPVTGLAQEAPSLSGMMPTETVCKNVEKFRHSH